MPMEDTFDAQAKGIQEAIAGFDGDQSLICSGCGEKMDFRVDQWTRLEPNTWVPTSIIKRDKGWARIMMDGQVVGVVCPACQIGKDINSLNTSAKKA